MDIFTFYAIIAVSIAIYNIYKVAEEQRTKRHTASLAADERECEAERRFEIEKANMVRNSALHGRGRNA